MQYIKVYHVEAICASYFNKYDFIYIKSYELIIWELFYLIKILYFIVYVHVHNNKYTYTIYNTNSL